MILAEPSRIMPWIMLLACLGIGLFSLFFVALRWFEYRQTFRPSQTIVSQPHESIPGGKELRVMSGGKYTLSAWFLPCQASSPYHDWLIVFSHGNAGNLSHRQDFFRTWHSMGFNILAYDYRGYGTSQGKPTEQGTYEDLRATIQWAEEAGFEPSRIILLGKSLGGGVASAQAARLPVAGLILHSTFTSLPDLGAELFPWLPVRALAGMAFPTRKRLASIQCPVLIIHSKEDELIGFTHAERNQEACTSPCQLIELDGGHNDPDSSRMEQITQGINQYMETLNHHDNAPSGR
ncbi:MAG: alpha/beta hydrolase [Verrucomicrobiota bacterium]